MRNAHRQGSAFGRTRKSTSILIYLLALFLFSSVPHDSSANNTLGLDIYYVRHAQTMANVTRDYSQKNQETFSEKGKQQITNLTNRLSTYHFDHILVSPTYRTRHTILPYLQKTRQVAELWPELAECCWQPDHTLPPSKDLGHGPKIIIQEKNKPFFKLRDPVAAQFLITKTYADGLVQVRKACDLLKTRFGQSGKSILMVGHSLAGALTMEVLAGRKPTGGIHLRNASITHLRQSEDGTTTLKMVSDIPQQSE